MTALLTDYEHYLAAEALDRGEDCPHCHEAWGPTWDTESRSMTRNVLELLHASNCAYRLTSIAIMDEGLHDGDCDRCGASWQPVPGTDNEAMTHTAGCV